MSKITKDMSHEEIIAELRTRPRGTAQPDPSFLNNKLVFKIVTLLHSDEYAAAGYLKQLEDRVGKDEAGVMVAKGLRNKKNKKRII